MPEPPLPDTVLGHRFSDPDILRRALSHCSSGADNNERLEFLGDAILGFIIAEALFQRFPEAKEGSLSRLRADLVQGSRLAEIAREQALGASLILGVGELKSGGTDRDSILADTLEALISAIYLDAGLEVCRERVLAVFSSHLASLDIDCPQKDAKTLLQEYLQSHKAGLPRYEVISIIGKDHEQLFSVSCEVDLLSQVVNGSGASRREAEQQAAEAALKALGQFDG